MKPKFKIGDIVYRNDGGANILYFRQILKIENNIYTVINLDGYGVWKTFTCSGDLFGTTYRLFKPTRDIKK